MTFEQMTQIIRARFDDVLGLDMRDLAIGHKHIHLYAEFRTSRGMTVHLWYSRGYKKDGWFVRVYAVDGDHFEGEDLLLDDALNKVRDNHADKLNALESIAIPSRKFGEQHA